MLILNLELLNGKYLNGTIGVNKMCHINESSILKVIFRPILCVVYNKRYKMRVIQQENILK